MNVAQTPPKPRPPAALSDEALRWIMRLHAGAATAADRKEFQSWRARSPEHEEAAAEAEALWGDAANLHQDPQTGVVRPGRREGGRSRRDVLAGAAVVAAGGGALWSAGALRGLASDYATGVGETRAIALPDGSQVTLNARSAIDVVFSEPTRRITLLEGQAFFEVAADAARPFEVRAREVTVTALGTAFDVDRSIADGGVAVAVTQHAVLVAANGGGAGLQLLEGQGVLVDAAGRVGAVTASDPAIATAWRKGMYIAEDKPLGDVIAALRAYHPGWIVIRGETIGKLRVNAVLNLRTPDESLDALAGGLPISVYRLSRYLTVISGL